MYICNCNGINQRQVQAALQAGAACYTEVLGHYGCAPQCGKCQCEIDEAIADRKTVRSVSIAPEYFPPRYASV